MIKARFNRAFLRWSREIEDFCNFSGGARVLLVSISDTMKTTLISLFTAALLGLASFASNHSFNSEELLSILFVAGLVGWTVTMYSRKSRPLTINRPIHLPLKAEIHSFPGKTQRLAA